MFPAKVTPTVPNKVSTDRFSPRLKEKGKKDQAVPTVVARSNSNDRFCTECGLCMGHLTVFLCTVTICALIVFGVLFGLKTLGEGDSSNDSILPENVEDGLSANTTITGIEGIRLLLRGRRLP